MVDSSVHSKTWADSSGCWSVKDVDSFDSLISGDSWVFRVKCGQGRIWATKFVQNVLISLRISIVLLCIFCSQSNNGT